MDWLGQLGWVWILLGEIVRALIAPRLIYTKLGSALPRREGGAAVRAVCGPRAPDIIRIVSEPAESSTALVVPRSVDLAAARRRQLRITVGLLFALYAVFLTAAMWFRIVEPQVWGVIPGALVFVALQWRAARREDRQILALRDADLIIGDPADSASRIPVADIRRVIVIRLVRSRRMPDADILAVERISRAQPGWTPVGAWEKSPLEELLRWLEVPIDRQTERTMLIHAARSIRGLRLPLAVSDPGLATAVRIAQCQLLIMIFCLAFDVAF